jgi:hypothetical protein
VSVARAATDDLKGQNSCILPTANRNLNSFFCRKTRKTNNKKSRAAHNYRVNDQSTKLWSIPRARGMQKWT